MDSEVHKQAWYTRPAVWIAAVAVAAVIGIIWAFNPLGFNNGGSQTGENPSGTTSSRTEGSSSAAGSSSTAGSSNATGTTSASSSAPSQSGSQTSLPNGLAPAYPEVYWEDSEACREFDVKTVMIQQGKDAEPVAFNGTSADNPVVGCIEDYAAFVGLSDRTAHEQQDQIQDVPTIILIAQWDGKRWLVESRQDEDGAQYNTSVNFYPNLRTFQGSDNTPASELMVSRLKAQGITVSDPEKLVGPNRVTWAFPSTSSWKAFDASKQGFTGQMRSDWTVSAKTSEVGNTTEDHAWFFDKTGATAFHLYRVATPSEAELKLCPNTSLPYEIDKAEPLGTQLENQDLSLALVTSEDEYGNEFTSVSLIPSSTPSSGKYCDFPRYMSLGGDQFFDTTLRPLYGFESDAEKEEFLASQVWKDSLEFAKSLTIEGNSAQ
ncbi:hypothetical protein HD598_000389 [Neomicrococcus aestuarii]|uniref:Uncharacterized protein n=1 Tax=Neomicrococcus aestuarii TaxID=556325 RepID=A0A7W8WYY8_9MICC|nr:hypothetical protein [Neomicrococcus aestuarii]MBB5511702.1 hypothetical protein [Neomicrococcus aestuarii]